MLPHELLEVKVPKHSEADMALDSGFFLIHIDSAKKELVAEYYEGIPCKENGAKLKHIFRGKCGRSIYREVAKRNLANLPDHLAYLGYELARAENCMKEGKRFVQDSDE